MTMSILNTALGLCCFVGLAWLASRHQSSRSRLAQRVQNNYNYDEHAFLDGCRVASYPSQLQHAEGAPHANGNAGWSLLDVLAGGEKEPQNVCMSPTS